MKLDIRGGYVYGPDQEPLRPATYEELSEAILRSTVDNFERLKSIAGMLASELREQEWKTHGDASSGVWSSCPRCSRMEGSPHEAWCELNLALMAYSAFFEAQHAPPKGESK